MYLWIRKKNYGLLYKALNFTYSVVLQYLRAHALFLQPTVKIIVFNSGGLQLQTASGVDNWHVYDLNL